MYEAQAAVRTIRNEGYPAFRKKLKTYLKELVRAPFIGIPRKKSLRELVDYLVDDSRLISASQDKDEFLELASVVKELEPKYVLEIGTARGGSLAMWCALTDAIGTVVSIDKPGGIHGGGYPYWKWHLYQWKLPKTSQLLFPLRCDAHSESVAQYVNMYFPLGIDFIFLDADHTKEGVRREFELYWPFLSPGGLLVVADISKHPASFNVSAGEFWAEFKEQNQEKYRMQEIINPLGIGWGGFGLIWKPPLLKPKPTMPPRFHSQRKQYV